MSALASSRTVDYLVIGGGFYGCCLALFLRSASRDVALVEAGDSLMNRASRVNQARLHSGFHYPRNMITALKSQMLRRRFAADFPDAIRSDFQMLYAIARQRSKVSANRFHKMFENMNAPIAPASPSECALFNDDRIEAVFRADEHAFDWTVLARHLARRLDALGVDVSFGAEVEYIEDAPGAAHAAVHLAGGGEVRARHVFNVTYSHINHVLHRSSMPLARLKHELAEIVLVDPPAEMEGYAVTVMDGPFFSLTPYPAEGKYALTHVRYTPHESWTDQIRLAPSVTAPDTAPPASRARHMILDAARYMPCMVNVAGGRPIFETKTVLIKNESDDGRPILVHNEPAGARVTSVLGGKIDNVYDLFSHLRATQPPLSRADTRYVVSDMSLDVLDDN